MKRYALLKNNKIVVIWSDNVSDETLDVYDLNYLNSFNVEVQTTYQVKYDDVKNVDSNLALLHACIKA